MKTLNLLLVILIGLTQISCSSDDDKVSCFELNIYDAEERPCEFYAEQFDCSCD